MTSKHEVSKKYKQIFEVINRIYKYGSSTEKTVRSSRIIAQKELADEWGITYNSIMDISGGVGTLTKLANWKQSSWNTIVNNPVGPSIDIFTRNTREPWDNVFNLIKEDILKITKKWSL